MTVLDEQAREVLRQLQPGDHFTLRGDNIVIRCTKVNHPIEQEPWADGYVVDRGGTLGNARAIRVSRIDRILPRKEHEPDSQAHPVGKGRRN